MSEKTLKSRIVHKHDIEANWLKATNFIPKQGEIIVYDVDANYNYERMKIGDGKTVVSSLPFTDDSVTDLFELVGDTSVAEQISNAISEIPQSNWNQSDKDSADYIKNRTHYVKSTEEVGDMVDVTVTGFEEFDGTYSGAIDIEIPEFSQFIYTFKVIWDGTEYLCERISESVVRYLMRATLTLGNQGILGEGEDTGEPFFMYIDEYNGSISITTTDAGTQHTIKIVAIYEDIQPLSGKYIPREIARTTDVENLVFDMVGDYPVSMQIEEAVADLVKEETLSDYATTEYVNAAVTNLVDSAPDTLDTLNELAAALGDDANFATTVANQIGQKANVSDVTTLQNLVGDTSVADQINTAVTPKMDKENPIGTGSFSLNRKADTIVGDNSFAEGNNTEASGDYSHAEGNKTTASGYAAHVEGHWAKATGDFSHAEGSAQASGEYSHAEGSGSQATGFAAHAEGGFANSYHGDAPSIASGDYSHAEGTKTTASGKASHAEGFSTTASSNYSHSEGQNTTASGIGAHAEGYKTQATGDYSHAEGGSIADPGLPGSTASGMYSHAEGVNTKASSDYQHVQGKSNIEDADGVYAHIVGNGHYSSPSNAHTLDWDGNAWFAGEVTIGSSAKTLATEEYVDSAAATVKNDLLNGAGEAYDTLKELGDLIDANNTALDALETVATNKANASDVSDLQELVGDTAVATQISAAVDPKMDKSNPTGTGSFSLNRKAYSDIGNYSFAEGYNTISSGEASHAEGTQTIASGSDSHAEGFTTEASSIASHSEGYKTIASGYASHAEGGQMNEDHSDTLSNRTISATDHPIIGTVDVAISSTTAQGVQSHAEGTQTFAFGYSSHAEGYKTNALGNESHTEGISTYAIGSASHAEGQNSLASGNYSHAEGNGTIAEGIGSHAEGGGAGGSGRPTASGDYSHAEGYGGVLASGEASHAEGCNTIASGMGAHAEGGTSGPGSGLTTASGDYSHAEGYSTTASGKASHAEGSNTNASGDASHAEGGNLYYDSKSGTIKTSNQPGSTTASGLQSHAEGYRTDASGEDSHTEGYETTASGLASHAEGYQTKASGSYSHTKGYKTQASGTASHAEGSQTLASGYTSHAEGYHTFAIGDYSHVEGDATGYEIYPQLFTSTADEKVYNITDPNGNATTKPADLNVGDYICFNGTSYVYYLTIDSIAKITAISDTSMTLDKTLGTQTKAIAYKIYGLSSGKYSHSEGTSFTAGDYSHAEGYSTSAYGYYSHAEGNGTIAYAGQHVEGSYNIPDTERKYLHIVGNGSSGVDRSNAHTLDKNGNAWFAGGVTATSFNGFTVGKSVPSNAVFTDTKYSAGTGISLSGTTINNSGVRSIGTGTANGTISVNTNGKTTNVAVKGLGSAAYTASTAYATSGHNHDSTYSKTTHNHDGRYVQSLGLNGCNINSTNGVWTVDISDSSHGSVPTPWVNVTQFSGGHFLVQIAIKCDNDSNASRPQGAVWIRNKYMSGAWSQWRQI